MPCKTGILSPSLKIINWENYVFRSFSDNGFKFHMTRIIPAFLLISLLMFSCSSSKKTLVNSPSAQDSVSSRNSVAIPPSDGKSFQTAIIIHETSDQKGIRAEYQWIRVHKSTCRIDHQSLANHGKKPYDIITIQYGDETKEDIYFDISNFFK
jgi:hypothetical protein